jgi:hypothetical protein
LLMSLSSCRKLLMPLGHRNRASQPFAGNHSCRTVVVYGG